MVEAGKELLTKESYERIMAFVKDFGTETGIIITGITLKFPYFGGSGLPDTQIAVPPSSIGIDSCPAGSSS